MSSPTILMTENYSLFKSINGNRNVNKSHVKKLKESIQIDPKTIFLAPILVNEKYEIIDGQHRVEAIRELGLPIYYIQHKGLDLDTVQKLNSTAKQWQPIDYAKAYAISGKKFAINYQHYVDAKDSEFGINHDSLLRYLALDQPITSISFKQGALVVPDFKKSMKLLKMLKDLSIYRRYKIRNFALAFLKLAQEKGYDHKRMVSQFKQHLDLFEDRASEVGYFLELNRIYNIGLDEVIFGDEEYRTRDDKKDEN